MDKNEKDLLSIANHICFITIEDMTKVEKNIARILLASSLIKESNGEYVRNI